MACYDYEKEKPKIFTDEGQRDFIKVRDEALRLLEIAGAFEMFKVLKGITGDIRYMMALVDRMVELGEIKEIKEIAEGAEGVVFNNRIFIKEPKSEKQT